MKKKNNRIIHRVETLFFLSLGSNLGDRLKFLRKAVTALNQNKNIQILKISNTHETEPYGKKDQPFFLNICVKGKTTLSPQELFKICRDTEIKLGRIAGEKWGPRIIDIDILFYGNKTINSPDLVIPHPDLHRRRFVLVPLIQIDSDLIHPVFKKTAADLLNECKDNSIVQIVKDSKKWTS